MLVPVAPKVLWSVLRDNRAPAHLATVRGYHLSTVGRSPAANPQNVRDAPLQSVAGREKREGKTIRTRAADGGKADRHKKLNASDR